MPPRPMPVVAPSHWGILAKMSWMMLAVPEPTLMPKSDGICPSMMTMAAAEMNPLKTGTEMNSSKKPSFRRPIASAYMPTDMATAEAMACAE